MSANYGEVEVAQELVSRMDSHEYATAYIGDVDSQREHVHLCWLGETSVVFHDGVNYSLAHIMGAEDAFDAFISIILDLAHAEAITDGTPTVVLRDPYKEMEIDALEARLPDSSEFIFSGDNA